VRVKAKGGITPEKCAGVSEQFSDKVVTDLEGLSIESYRTECRMFGPVRDGSQNPLNCRSPTKYRAEEGVAGPALGTGIHLLAILLIFEDDRDIVGL
jgi:hypothetical protein